MLLEMLLAAGLAAQTDSSTLVAPPAAEVTTGAADQTGVVSYPASFFLETQANNAFDMIARLPGFTFARGESVRGFAGAAGNVLIDGERPTSKSVTLEELLRRLPAGSVVRIDLIRGGAPGIDMQGQALVANVIRSRATSQNLAVTTGVRLYTQDGWLGPQADLEWARRNGDLSLEGAIRHGWTASPNGGDGALTKYFPDGSLKESGPYLQRRRAGLTTANGSAELTLGQDLFRVNLGVSRNDGRPFESIGRVLASGVSRGEAVTIERTIEDKLEAGTDYTHVFRPGLSMQVLALQTLGRLNGAVTSTQPGTLQTSDNEETSGESIARGQLTWQPSEALSIESGGEAAFNFLEGHNKVAVNSAPVALPNANLRVEERRAEAFVTAVWKPTAKFTVNAGTRLETSEISSTGDTNRSRSFFFAKPRVVVSYAPDPSSQIRLRLEREVSQLRFRDFVTSADFTTGVFNGGNANLQPSRAWVAESTFERRFWGKGAVSVALAHEEVEEVVDLIPVGAGDAPGNIGNGQRDQIDFTLTAPLDRVRIPNGLLTSQITWNWSEVTDPVTGEARRISGELPIQGRITLTQDVPALRSTWALEAALAESGVNYRISETRRQSEQASVNFIWTWKPDPSLTLRAELRNLASRERERVRKRFLGSRAAGVLNELEIERHTFAPFAYFSVRKAL